MAIGRCLENIGWLIEYQQRQCRPLCWLLLHMPHFSVQPTWMGQQQQCPSFLVSLWAPPSPCMGPARWRVFKAAWANCRHCQSPCQRLTNEHWGNYCQCFVVCRRARGAIQQPPWQFTVSSINNVARKLSLLRPRLCVAHIGNTLTRAFFMKLHSCQWYELTYHIL